MCCILYKILSYAKCNTHSVLSLLTEMKIVVSMLQNFKNYVKFLVSSRANRGLWWLLLADSWTIWHSFSWVVIVLWPLELECTLPLLQDHYRVHLWGFLCKPCPACTCWLLYVSNLNLEYSNPLSLSSYGIYSF